MKCFVCLNLFYFDFRIFCKIREIISFKCPLQCVQLQVCAHNVDVIAAPYSSCKDNEDLSAGSDSTLCNCDYCH